MNYEEFKDKIIEDLEKYYGKDAKISVVEELKLNGERVDQLTVTFSESRNEAIPCHTLNKLYNKYILGILTMDECVGEIVDYKDNNEHLEGCKSKIIDWNYAKDKLIPILINTEANKELLENVVSVEWLDLSIVFLVREKQPDGGFWSVRVSKNLLCLYNISVEQLMDQAFANLRGEGFRLSNIQEIGVDYNEENLEDGFIPFSSCEQMEEEGLFLLSNPDCFYGASKILDKEVLQKICGSKNAYIIPSSVHETLFLSDVTQMPLNVLNKMIAEINGAVVRSEEVLSNHAYFYDADTRDIRIAA